MGCHSDITFGVCFGVWSVLFPHRCVFWGWLIAFRIVWIVVFLLVVIGFMPCHTRVVFWLFFSASLKFYEHEKMTDAWCWVFPYGLQFSWCVDAFLCLDVVLFGPFAVVMRWVPQFMLEASFRHVDVCLLPQGSCGIFAPRSGFICRRLVSTRGKSLAEQLCCVLCVVCLSWFFKCFVFVPRVHRFPEHMVSMFSSGLDEAISFRKAALVTAWSLNQWGVHCGGRANPGISVGGVGRSYSDFHRNCVSKGVSCCDDVCWFASHDWFGCRWKGLWCRWRMVCLCVAFFSDGGSRGFEQSSPSFTGSAAESTSGRAMFASLLCCFQIHVDRAAFSSRCWVALEEPIVRRRWSSNVRSVWDGKKSLRFEGVSISQRFQCWTMDFEGWIRSFFVNPFSCTVLCDDLGLCSQSHTAMHRCWTGQFFVCFEVFLLRVLREFSNVHFESDLFVVF